LSRDGNFSKREKQGKFRGRSQRPKKGLFDHERVNNSVFKNSNDESIIKATMLTVFDGLGNLEPNDKGLFLIKDVAGVIAEKNSSLSDVSVAHLVEIYLKDPDECIRLEGDSIGRKNAHYVEPPESLFFGTVDKFFDKMVECGIHSGTKPFIRLYEDEDDAVAFARQFLRPGQSEDEICTILVNSGEAFREGIKFSSSEKWGEYLTTSITPNYIDEESDEGLNDD